jgi:hypothetical protein
VDKVVGNLYRTQEIDSDVGRFSPDVIHTRYYICTELNSKNNNVAEFVGERANGEERIMWKSMGEASYHDLPQEKEKAFVRSMFSL